MGGGSFLGGPVTHEYGQAYVTVGDAGNRAPVLSEYDSPFGPPSPDRRFGAVGYDFRIARTEFTISQHYEFAMAYAPYYFADNGTGLGSSNFYGLDFTMIGLSNGSVSAFGYNPEVEANKPSVIGWEYAARYVNWLHNGKSSERSAFESGVYDTSTFTFNEDGSANHNFTRSADAKFWIPTMDEWTKAAHWDPNKDGGAGGYWQYPDGSDTDLIAGLLPEDGGEKNSGFPSDGFPLDVGSFEDVFSPWGVQDMGGGAIEWTSTEIGLPQTPADLWVDGTGLSSAYGDPLSLDRLSTWYNGSAESSLYGFRIAALAVPGPGGAGVFLVVGIAYIRRSR